MSTLDWVFVVIVGGGGTLLAIKGGIWVVRRLRETMREIDNFWRGFSRMFVGNDR